MALPVERTLGDLRGELQARLGFGNQGAPSLLNRTLLNSFLRDAQVEVYWKLQRQRTRQADTPLALASGQTVYDWPTGTNPDQNIYISVLVGTVHFPVVYGITLAMRSGGTISAYPRRWDHLGGQIEVWPSPDAVYTATLRDVGTLGAFTADADRCTVPSDLVFRLALYSAKLHYRQPDAEGALGAFNSLLGEYRGSEHVGRRYFRRPRQPVAPAEPYGAVPPVRV